MDSKKKTTKEPVLYPAFLAGVSIGIAAMCYLKGGVYVGAALFAFGLSAVVCSKWKLFTGMIGFFNGWKEFGNCFTILWFNVIGAIIAAQLAYCMGGDVVETANNVVNTRLTMFENPFKLLLMSAGCGFIMTVSVKHARKKNWIPLLFGIPTFVMCGFPHCVADIVYYVASDITSIEVLWAWLLTVAGNTIGCNVPTFIRFDKPIVPED